MKKLLLISFLLTLLPCFGFAQCGTNELEVRVNINTDNWGDETSWKLTDLSGTIILQGGQNGAYGNFSSYADSICIPVGSCIFFEIYDTYGDGILAPYGYQLFFNEILVSSGANEILNYASTVVNCSDSCGMVLNALNDLQAHISGTTTLTAGELTLVKNIFVQFSECLAQSESTLLLAKNVVEDFDNQIGALFTTPGTQYGFSKDPAAAPGLELERATLALEQGIFDYVFTPEVYGVYPQYIHGWQFNSCTAFPGYVAPPADSTLSNSVLIRANFEDPDGVNPYYDINQDRMKHALRPTGLYLSPGSVAHITVPDSLVGKDYWIRVGSHDWDLTRRSEFKRLDRISKRILINSSNIAVFNPLGGAISVLVPYGADDGIVEISVQNAVKAPFFSWKTFYKTPDFNAELSKPGPWAVFETDNVMYTIPKHSIVPGQYDLKKTMLDWDAALQAVNSIMARQIIPDKHNMYMIADLDIRFDAYSIGYPMSNTPLNYNDIPGPAYFIDGPGPDDETNFHESGHALAMSKFPGEEEALVNFPYVMAMNYGLGVDLNEAVNYSFVPNTYGIDNTATHRMVSNTFGTKRDISNTTTDEVRYQHRGYGHYFEIVNTLGWCPLRNFWKQESIDFEQGIDYGTDQSIDSRIVRMSVAAQADLRPLFHVFGIIAQDSIAVEDTLAQIGVLPSSTLYNRLQAYFDLIPEDKTAFINYALSVYPNLYTDGPTADPDYGVGWHYLKSLTYDAVEGQHRADILQSIIDRYYPNGAPVDNGTPDVCCLLDTLQINMVNQEIIVTGGVKPYTVSMDTTGNIKTVTVVDFDGCETTVQFPLATGLSEEGTEGIKIYPNPTSTEIYIDLTGSSISDNIEGLQIVSINGQVIKVYGQDNRIIDVSALSEGMYILQINLASGQQINRRFLIFENMGR